MNEFVRWLKGLLFPRGCVCLICDEETLVDEDELCEACRSQLRLAVAPPARLPLDGIQSGLMLANDVKRCIYRFKRGNRREYARFLLRNMYIPNEWHADLLVPVPMHALDTFFRETHHTLILAEALSKIYGIPVSNTLLYKAKRNKQQKRLSPVERQRNVRNAFAVYGDCTNRVIVLIDDVYTTGATVAECARVLKLAGAARVYAATAASAM